MKGRSHRLQSHHESHDDWVDGSWTVDCVCGVTFDDGEEMVNCDECGVWVHTRCSRYVKGEELFACDKCKSKNNRTNDSEETEVAQLLVELPTKTIQLESNCAAGNESHAPLWSNSMEGRVHVQGIPGGDPALFSGLSSVFTPELWKCTGYVPKKFNFKYKEFPCWEEEKEGGAGRNEEENENTVDKGAGVLFSLSKESVFATPITALVGVRERDEEVAYEKKSHSKKWENEDGELRRFHIGVKKERSLLRPIVLHSGKRRKEDMGTSKDRSGRKKARVADREVDVKKRSPHTFKTVAFTSTNDAKQLELYEDIGLKSFKDDNQIAKNKSVRDPAIQEQESDTCVTVGNELEKPKNNLVLVEQPSDDLSSDDPRHNCTTVTELKEHKASPKVPVVVDSSLKVSDVYALAWEHNDGGRTPVKHEGDDIKSGSLDDYTEGSAGSDVKPPVDEPAGAAPEDEGNQINGVGAMPPGSSSHGVKELENNNPKGVLDHKFSVRDATELCDDISENSKVTDGWLGGSPSNDPKALGVDRTSEVISVFQEDKADEVTGDPCQHKQQTGESEGSTAVPDHPLESKNELGFEDQPKSGETVLSSSLLPCQRKVVLCVGKSTSSSIMGCKPSTSQRLKSTESPSSDPKMKQQLKPEANSDIRIDHATSDVVKDEDDSESSRKIVKERGKLSVNFASKVTNSSKNSHPSAPKRTISDSKGPSLYGPSKSFSAHNHEVTELLQNESASNEQNKIPETGLPLRSEKFTSSNGCSSSKGNQAPSINFPVPSIPATLSDEELALLLHQELNSSPRVPRVPRVRQAGSLPHLASPTATTMLLKRSSSSGGKDHSVVPRRKMKESPKDLICRSYEANSDARRTDRVQSSPDRRKDKSCNHDALPIREENRSSTVGDSVKKSILPTSTSTANSGPSSSNEVNDQHLSSLRNSPRNFSDEETVTTRGPVHLTLPGLINEIMSKGRRMTYEELCNAVLPHWHSLRKHNGERYAYSSHSQAVLDCLRNRHEWACLVDRGPKTSASRKRRKFDHEESENDYGKGRTAREGDRKHLESQKEDFPKGKRKARKRRRLQLQGRGIKDVRKRQKAGLPSDEEDSDPFSNSSDGSLYSEDEIQGGAVGSESSAYSDETRTM